MTLWTLFMFLFSLGALAWGWYQLRKAKIQNEMNILLAGAVEELYASTTKEIHKNKKLVEKAQGIAADAKESLGLGEKASGKGEMMEDAGMLATLVTVIVHKYGDIKLGIADFSELRDDDYVSVYVDTLSQDLILSLSKDMASSEDFTSFASLAQSDDETYH